MNKQAKGKPVSMAPTFLSSEALLQLQDFAEIAFLKSAHFSHSAK